jgi:hypothetical protein
MQSKSPQRMTYTQWRRTPFRTRHRLIGLLLNDHFRDWRSCADACCRRTRRCQDYQYYWRNLSGQSLDEQRVVR